MEDSSKNRNFSGHLRHLIHLQMFDLVANSSEIRLETQQHFLHTGQNGITALDLCDKNVDRRALVCCVLQKLNLAELIGQSTASKGPRVQLPVRRIVVQLDIIRRHLQSLFRATASHEKAKGVQTPRLP